MPSGRGRPPVLHQAVRFQIPGPPQAVEIGGIRLLNFRSALDVRELTSDLPYEGRSPLAGWRGAARQRIAVHRRSNLTVRVFDRLGAPVSGVSVHAELERHGFDFGSAVKSQRLAGNQPDDLIYQDHVRHHFAVGTSEEFLKWTFWERMVRTFATDPMNWLEANGLRLRGAQSGLARVGACATGCARPGPDSPAPTHPRSYRRGCRKPVGRRSSASLGCAQ